MKRCLVAIVAAVMFAACVSPALGQSSLIFSEDPGDRPVATWGFELLADGTLSLNDSASVLIDLLVDAAGVDAMDDALVLGYHVEISDMIFSTTGTPIKDEAGTVIGMEYPFAGDRVQLSIFEPSDTIEVFRASVSVDHMIIIGTAAFIDPEVAVDLTQPTVLDPKYSTPVLDVFARANGLDLSLSLVASVDMNSAYGVEDIVGGAVGQINTELPEPATIGLVGFGVMLLARRRRKAQP